MIYPTRITLFSLFCVASLNTHAYNYITCPDAQLMDFNSGHMTFNYGNNLSVPQKNAISLGHSRLTAFSDASITTVDNGDSDFYSGNGENEIYLDSSVATASCSYWYYTETCTVAEADMHYGNQAWKTVDNSQHLPYANGRSMTGTAVHEGGHCIGMAHSTSPANMMGTEFSYVTRQGIDAYYGPGEDLSDGLIDLHGKKSGSNSNRDVGITVMRYDGFSGEYSRHKFGVLRNSGGGVLPVVGNYVGQNTYQVLAGTTVQMELMAENNGEEDTEFPNVGFYLSTNDVISATDTYIAEADFTLGRDAPFETTEEVTIPADTATGNYFLGAYIDHDSAISETTVANNIAYYPVHVIATPDLVVELPGVSDDTLEPEQSFTVSATVSNAGGAQSAASSLRYYVSSDATISTADVEMTAAAVGTLSAGTSSELASPDVSLAANGSFWVGACVDSVAGESNTSNQCSAGVPVTVAIPPGC